MSAATISQAAADTDLRARVVAMAHKELEFDEAKQESTYGKLLAAGSAPIEPLIWPVAVATEAAYESALAAGRGAPGHDADVITDGDLTAAINAAWPYDPEPEVP
jgi:hypothetical protein